MASLSFISLNVERSKHLDLVVPFLEKRTPDVLCIQELNESDIPLFEALFKNRTEYVQFSLYKELTGETDPIGICIFSRFPLLNTAVRYYVGSLSDAPGTVRAGDAASFTEARRAILCATVEADGISYRIGTTHFTWSEGGAKTELQREHFASLINVLKEEKELILCGDFNLPRGGELFGQLASIYKDNIPAHYKTSIDVELHRARDTDPEGLSSKMVDGLFTTPEYSATDVELVPGVSDHYAIVATIQKGA